MVRIELVSPTEDVDPNRDPSLNTIVHLPDIPFAGDVLMLGTTMVLRVVRRKFFANSETVRLVVRLEGT